MALDFFRLKLTKIFLMICVLGDLYVVFQPKTIENLLLMLNLGVIAIIGILIHMMKNREY